MNNLEYQQFLVEKERHLRGLKKQLERDRHCCSVDLSKYKIKEQGDQNED